MFDTVAHRDMHLEKCEKSLVNDDTVFELIFKEVQENEETNDIVKEMELVYRNTLIRIHALNQSGIHRHMYEEFQSLLQSYTPEMAAKRVVKINKAFFENFDEETSSDESDSL